MTTASRLENDSARVRSYARTRRRTDNPKPQFLRHRLLVGRSHKMHCISRIWMLSYIDGDSNFSFFFLLLYTGNFNCGHFHNAVYIIFGTLQHNLFWTQSKQLIKQSRSLLSDEQIDCIVYFDRPIFKNFGSVGAKTKRCTELIVRVK